MRGKGAGYAAVIAALLLATRSFAAAQADFEDDATQSQVGGNLVRLCASGAMRGVDAASGAFMCAPLDVSNPIVDTSTQTTFTYYGASHKVHTCPNDLVMVGWERADGRLVCATVTGGLNGSRFSDTGTQELEPKHDGRSLHACIEGSYMVGIEESDDVLICQSP
jgi:hypothetical protein